MTIRTAIPLMIIALLAASCGNNPQSASTGADDMAKFAKDSNFQQAHQDPASISFQGKGEMVSFATPDGKQGSAYLLKTEQATDKVLFVIQEWWGLNDHIKQEAERLFGGLEGVTVMALDMYDGKVATTPEDAGAIMNAVDPLRCEAIIKGALARAGTNARVATIGWCFGGGWSLRASILAGKQAAGCVMYYGMPLEKAAELAPLQADVLGIFAVKDAWITPKVVTNFQNLAKATNKKVEIHSFDADHAFANPSNPNYDKINSDKANALALEFLKKKLS
ncbi:MAG: dienelactone hydrolase family protein [Saprospiraceae bacterium]|nr:dienelactone hydrolase family protein [Saprospiraceae bacterium]